MLLVFFFVQCVKKKIKLIKGIRNILSNKTEQVYKKTRFNISSECVDLEHKTI